MTQAYNALCLSQTTNTTLDNRLKLILRAIACDDVVLYFKDGSYLVYQHNKDSWRFDCLFIANLDDLFDMGLSCIFVKP